jgi:SAM-dependent methyltransferase
MKLDVVQLRSFYATPLGGVVRHVVSERIRRVWPSVAGETVIGLGYAAPYLGVFRGEARRLGALMPAAQGVVQWPPMGDCQSVLVEDEHLPLPDNSVDRLLAVHSLEFVERTRPMLRDVWRVLAPEGRALFVVPNRLGLWSFRDATPFGYGHPYSRTQIEANLLEAMFASASVSTALHLPPVDRPFVVRWSRVFERTGARLMPRMAGVLLVEVRKELATPAGHGAKVRAIFAPASRAEPARMVDEAALQPRDPASGAA